MNLAETSQWLLIIGGVNWFLFGLTKKDVFDHVGMGMNHSVAKITYLIIGLAAIYRIFA